MEILLKVTGDRMRDPGPLLVARYRPAAQEIVQLLTAAVQRGTPIGVTEAARGSIAGELRSGGMGLPVGTIGSPLRHVQVVNDGRRPGQKMPPPDALLLWVKRKLKIEERSKRRRRNAAGELESFTTRRSPTDDEALQVAWLIARAIGKRGTRGEKMFEKAIQQSQSRIGSILAAVGLHFTIDAAKA